jgi:Acyl-CoA carboxylase epsilon subunit
MGATDPLRVLRGNPADDELAAVLVLLRSLARRPEEGPSATEPLPAGGWGPVTLPWPAARAS